MDTVLEKVLPYEGIPEITLNFVSPEERHRKGSLVLQKQLEKKYKKVEGTKTFFNNRLHSYDDSSIINEEVGHVWWLYGKLHRENDKPAIIWFNNKREWWLYGQLHRENDKPAVIYPWRPGILTYWIQEWWIHGKPRRESGERAIVWSLEPSS